MYHAEGESPYEKPLPKITSHSSTLFKKKMVWSVVAIVTWVKLQLYTVWLGFVQCDVYSSELISEIDFSIIL